MADRVMVCPENNVWPFRTGAWADQWKRQRAARKAIRAGRRVQKTEADRTFARRVHEWDRDRRDALAYARLAGEWHKLPGEINRLVTDEEFNLLTDMRWALGKLDAVDLPTSEKPMRTEDEIIGIMGRGD